MAAKHHRHVALTEVLMRFIDAQVAEERYASASEVVRAGLLLLIEREEVLADPATRDGASHG